VFRAQTEVAVVLCKTDKTLGSDTCVEQNKPGFLTMPSGISCVSDVGDLPIRGCGLIECPWRWGHGGDGPCFRDHAVATGDSFRASGIGFHSPSYHEQLNRQHAHSREVQERACFLPAICSFWLSIAQYKVHREMAPTMPGLKRSRGPAAPWAKTRFRIRR
jgi:hypothetical protein